MRGKEYIPRLRVLGRDLGGSALSAALFFMLAIKKQSSVSVG
jgi:hypothetical protein